jgi:DNA helicase-2/ATP-dependent DNA helicase PcrA
MMPAMLPVEWNDLIERTVPGPSETRAGWSPAAQAALTADLNPAQAEAVLHGPGPLLILAGAGSGKTRVITRRVAHLVASGRAQAHEILAITFTNRAAREMRERILALESQATQTAPGGFGDAAGQTLSRAWVSTFHALGARLLRREIEQLGGYTRDFTIYDTADKQELIKGLLKELEQDPQRFRPAALAAYISAVKQRQAERWDPAEHDSREIVDAEQDPYGEERILAQVAELYQARLRAANALDFDDLLLLTLELFERSPGTRDRYAQQFRFVLVDEYQDTNRVQYLITRHLARGHGNLAVCGDPDQSIYAWRGADLRNILEFERDFPGALVVKLEHNYRSTARILSAAQGLIEHNQHRKPKRLIATGAEGEPVGLIEASDENDEADAIAAEIKRLWRSGELGSERPLDHVAIFYRVNFLSRAIERGLSLASLPYQVAGGVEFYARREVRDLIAYLQLVVNPADDVAFQRVVNVPARGIGDKSLEQLSELARARGQSLLRCAQSGAADGLLRGRAKGGLAGLMELLVRLGEAAALGPAGVLELLVEATEFQNYLTKSDPQGAEERVDNVRELIANARLFEREQPNAGLPGFLQDVALVSDVDSLDDAAGESAGPPAGAVTLMTMHSAKGLEFKAVFIVGCEEDLLPHGRALEEEDGQGGRGLEEERRLLYVGLTRARERLFLSRASTRMYFGETSWRKPSRFLAELPPGCLAAGEPDLDEEQALGAFEQDSAELSAGDWVRHGHFGVGQIERLSGSGANARATVRFQQVGQKILLLQYANLERVQA